MVQCPKCQFDNLNGAKFCNECGYDLRRNLDFKSDKTKAVGVQATETHPDKIHQTLKTTDSERKYVTVIFSDLSGYTAMSERMDPEEVKDITTHIFNEISKIISNYEGFIEKYAGDAVMALFGATKAHEDDPIRAVRAAREIHNLVASLSPRYEEKIGQLLSMHTGINTGLVVTGQIDMEKGTHGVTGDAINVASRLSGLSGPGEILVGANTYLQTKGYFDFEEMKPEFLKGRSEAVQVYKVLAAKDKPIKIHRFYGLRAELIGRVEEMNQLSDAIQKLTKEKKGTIVSICGIAGTGKSRLIEELRSSLNLDEVQWLEGHAYPYSQNIAYYPLMDLLAKVLKIEEGDLTEKVKEKIESGLADIIGEQIDIIPYIGSLFSIKYPEIEDVSPEYWKEELQRAAKLIFSGLGQSKLTVICIEDLHWADHSFLDLIRLMLKDFNEPVLFIFSYRPTISLFSRHQISGLSIEHREIHIHDLSPSESQVMVESLLKTNKIPIALQEFVEDKIEGNPFYIEEVINSLIESQALVRENGAWKVTRPIAESEISSTIHGVIAGRLDRLEKEAKRILQEAAVIGRTFFYEILKKITELKDHIDSCLIGLEQLDLIKTRKIQPDIEYIFKHALTQEVVYSGLLKKERRTIHERIGIVMEKVFRDRLPEFYETLAFHFKIGHSFDKAIDYLIKSGEKSLRRYALKEANQHYKEAFDILSKKSEKSVQESQQLISLILKWALVYNYRGDFKGLTDLLLAHEDMAKSLDDKAIQGMYNAWLGFCWYVRGYPKESYQYLTKALILGDEIENNEIVGYACTWLTWTCEELGLLEEGNRFGERAQEISINLKGNHYIHFSSLGGLGHICFSTGDKNRVFEIAKKHLNYSEMHSDIRSMVFSHIDRGIGYFIVGDHPKAIECFKSAIQISPDPFFLNYAKFLLGVSLLSNDQTKEAEDALEEVKHFGGQFGAQVMEYMADAYLGVVQIINGQMSKGLKRLKDGIRICEKNERKSNHALLEFTLGEIYLNMLDSSEPVSLSALVKNIGFLLKNVPFAAKKAEEHINNSINIAEEIGASGFLGLAYLSLGHLHKLKKRTELAKECISKAINYLEQCGAEVYLKQANEALESLK